MRMNRQNNLVMFLSLTVALVPASLAHAQDSSSIETATASKSAEDILFSKALRSLIEPETPTFQLLGVAANEVARPESPKQIALGLLNNLDQDGNFQSGLALEFSPYLLMSNSSMTLREYKEDAWRRQLSYLQVSLGTAKGSSDKDKSVKASIGLLWTPINGMDPYANESLTSCLDQVLLKAGPPPPPPQFGEPAPASPQAVPGRLLEREITDPQAAAEIASLKARIAELEAKVGLAPQTPAKRNLTEPPHQLSLELNASQSSGNSLKQHQDALSKGRSDCIAANPLLPDNTTSLQFGIAPLFISESGDTSDFKSRGYAATALLSLGLSKAPDKSNGEDTYRSQVLFSLSYRDRETISDPDNEGSFLVRDRWNIGGRFVFGKPTSVFYSLETAYQKADYRDGRSDNFITFAGGLDFQIDEGFWLGLSAGTSTGRSVGADSIFIGSRFRWGFGQKSEIGTAFVQPAKQE